MGTQSGVELQRLVDAARSGNSDALGTLLETYRNYLALLARVQIDGRIQAKASSSDVVQETFLQARKAFSQFQGTTEGEFVAWLRSILASRTANLLRHYRAARRDVKLEQQMEVRLGESSVNLERMLAGKISSPSVRAVRREQSVLLADALAELPTHYRDVIVARHLEGHSFAEIAERTDRTVASVKNLWARGIGKLRVQLGDQQ